MKKSKTKAVERIALCLDKCASIRRPLSLSFVLCYVVYNRVSTDSPDVPANFDFKFVIVI